MDKEIHYTYLGANCPGACVDNVITLPDLNPWELAVRGHKIVFQNERTGTHNTDIYLYYLDNPDPVAVPITTASENQTNPDISDTWISWADDSTGQTEIHAKRIDGTEERIIEGPINYGHALGGDNLVFARGSLRDPDVGVWLLDLGDPTSEPTRLSDMEGVRPDIDADSNDKVVWDSATPRSAPRQVYLHDLTSGETQQVSTTPETSLAFMSVISNTHIVWSDDRAAVRNLYENELGDTAYALAVRYAPHLYLHKEEYFEPRPVGIFVDGEGTRLRERRSSGDITLHEWPDLYLGTLGQYTSANDQPGIINGGKYIDLPGSVLSSRISHWVFDNNYIKRYDGLINQYQYPELYYAKVVRNSTGDGVAIQYWIPYYFNNFDNYHEGDWEMVQVNLEDDLDDLMPRSVALSQHLGGIKASWQYIDHDQTGYHPVIYVARGSHANYFAAGEYPVVVENWFDATDHTEVNNPIHEPQVTVLSNVNSSQIGSLVPGPYSWLAYQGAWGEMVGGGIGFDGPQGPAATPEHSDSWDDPFTWSEGLCDNGDPQCAGVYYDDSYGSVASPVDIHLYDVAGNHVGKNETGGIDEQVPGAEYIEIPELHRKTIIIHGGDASAGYRFVLEGTGVGTFNFTIASPDRANNSSDVVDYVDVPVTASTQVELNLVQNADYELKIDHEGNGSIDEQRPPDSVTGHDIDLNPPAAVHDLSVVNVSSDTVSLAFTAPGDDGNAGSAQYYDVRYSDSLITESNWKEAEPVEIIPLPQPAGIAETINISGLLAGTNYYFALKAKDDVLRVSPLSNVTMATTTIPELTWTKTGVYWANWNDYINRHLSIDYRMDNIGTGIAIGTTIQDSLCVPDTVYVVTTLPQTTGDIDSGGYVDVTLKYYVPTNVGSFTATTYATCDDDSGRAYWFPEPMP